MRFLCSIWQKDNAVDVFSSTNKLLPSLESKNLILFIPGFMCKRTQSHSGYEIYYREQKEFEFISSADNKLIKIGGRFEILEGGEVIPYLACGLLEMQRQTVGETSAHTAAVSLNAKGVLLMGKEGSGKTSIAFYLCREYGYKLIANDIALISYNKGQAFIDEGTKFFWFRLEVARKNHPDLVRFFSPSKEEPWTNRVIIQPQQVGVEVESETVPIIATFLLHIDDSVKREIYTERSKGKWPRLYLYENFSRYIRRTCSPIMGGKEFRYLTYLPSLDNPDFHAKRVLLINHLIDKVGIQYVAGGLKEVGDKIHQMVNLI